MNWQPLQVVDRPTFRYLFVDTAASAKRLRQFHQAAQRQRDAKRIQATLLALLTSLTLGSRAPRQENQQKHFLLPTLSNPFCPIMPQHW